MRKHREYRPMADINVTNLVDVVLVLLIVFMISAPMMQAGVEIDLPKASESPRDVSAGIVISIDKNQQIFIDQYKVKSEDFVSRLKNIREVKKFRPIFIRADRSIPYGTVIELMDKIKKMGIENVGLVTEPETRL
ncbi:MAG: biopolymer transporter ExbD [candidate division Zixibacteria bacterium]